ncbi:MAG: DsbA family protein [Bdellovibrionota bacterium]
MKSILFFTTLLTLLPFAIPAAEAASLIGGSQSASVQVVIYGDIQCPFTKKVMGYLDQLETDYGNRIGVQFSHFPLSFHVNAKPAAIAANCAGEQEEFAPFLKQAFAHQDRLGSDFYVETAKSVGVRDLGAFSACLTSKNSADAVDTDFARGESAGVNSTPTLFVNSEVMRGAYPYAELKALIDKALKN